MEAKNCCGCTRSPALTATCSTSDCTEVEMFTERIGSMVPLTTTLSDTPSLVATV